MRTHHANERTSAHFGADPTRRKIGEVMLDLKNISLSFGGVKALTDISFDVRSMRSAPSSVRTAPARARCST
jgi:ATPase subunit of ABC transporter with duplicated ATPase domains